MAKAFHINDDLEAKECSSPNNCQFGKPANEHFYDAKSAGKESERLMAIRHGAVNTITPQKVTPMRKLRRLDVPTNNVTSLLEHKFDVGPTDVSTIDLIEEKPTPQFLEAIRSGQVTAFAA